MPVSAPDPTGRSPALVIAERPRSIVAVSARRGRADALAAAVTGAFDLALPGPGRFRRGATLGATWIQPGVWLLDGAPEAPGALYRRVVEAVRDTASVVDQSHGRTLVHVSGAAARAVLATCCRLDLHPRVVTPGTAATTLVAHVPCTLRAVDDGFELLVGSTYAGWLLEDLAEASAAAGAEVVPAAPRHRSAILDGGSAR